MSTDMQTTEPDEDPRDVAIRAALNLCDRYAGPDPTIYGEGPYRAGMRDLASAVAEQIRTALSTYPECVDCDGRVDLLDGILRCVNCGEPVGACEHPAGTVNGVCPSCGPIDADDTANGGEHFVISPTGARHIVAPDGRCQTCGPQCAFEASQP